MNVLEIKAAVRQRDGMRCTECGMTNDEHRNRWRASLEVHRLEPGSPYSVDGCVTLCKGCHRTKDKSPWGTGAKIMLRPRIHAVLLQLAERNYQPIKSIVHVAIREYLERQGLWPVEKRRGEGEGD